MSLSPPQDQRRVESLFTTDSNGFRRVNIPYYEYDTLDPDAEVARFIVLEPCSGDKEDHRNYVRCRFEVQHLARADGYIAIRNARGYRLLQEVIELDSKALLIPAALEKFLRHFRRSDSPVRLWTRYLCVNEGNSVERLRYWTRSFADRMYERAKSVIDMHSFLSDLQNQGVFDRVIDSRYREWTKVWDVWDEPRKEYPLPKVFPIRLGKNPSNENPTDDYEYLPLDRVADETRIIVVATNKDSEAPLVLHLAHSPVNCEIAYHALSYTWGTGSEKVMVVVNGQKMWIRKTLANALRALRSPTHGFIVWADAVCINQSDIAEKNHSLDRIAAIFDRAFCVVCYVGGVDEYSNLALDFVPHLQGPVIRSDKYGDFEIGKPDRIDPEKLPRFCAALYLFLIRPYFRRVWVIQEVALASNPRIGCGNRFDVSFEQLESAACNLQDMLARDPGLSERMKAAVPELKAVSPDELVYIRKLFYFRHLQMGGVRHGFRKVAVNDKAPGYLETAILARNFGATVPHDKIFALWDIARDKGGLRFKMDYSSTYEDTFREFAKAWSLYSGSLDIIGAAEFILSADGKGFYSKAPSWCPDWSQPSRSSSLIRREVFRRTRMEFLDDIDGRIYCSDGGMRQASNSNAYFEFDGNTLNCLGIILDSILATAPVDPEDDSIEAKISGLIPATEEFCIRENLTIYEDVAQAVSAMLHGDAVTSWPKREDNLENIDEDYPDEKFVCIPHKPKLNQEQTSNASYHVPSFGGSYSRQEAWEVMQTIMRGRKVFITEKGYVGLMPKYVNLHSTRGSTRSSLQVAILATCSVPVLLQKHPEIQGAYRLMGTCFVQGWMEGEVLKHEMGCDRLTEFWEALKGSEKLTIV